MRPLQIRHGADVPTAKLDDDKVRRIRQRLAAGETMTDIARDYHVTPPTIFDIKQGTTWAHVTETKK